MFAVLIGVLGVWVILAFMFEDIQKIREALERISPPPPKENRQ